MLLTNSWRSRSLNADAREDGRGTMMSYTAIVAVLTPSQ